MAFAAELDLVAMRNGDIHNGTLAPQSFVLETAYGVGSVPSAAVARLAIGRDGGAVLFTCRGERFSGRVRGEGIYIERVLDTALPLAFTDIESIELAGGKEPDAGAEAPDAVELADGDRFSARVGAPELALETGAGVDTFQRREIRLLDLARIEEDEPPRARLVLREGGGSVQGELRTPALLLETRFGDRLEVPAARVGAMAFEVGKWDFTAAPGFRQLLDPARTLRDRLRDGAPGPLLVKLPAGEYLRGDLQGDGDGDEKPPRRVRIAPFAIGVQEVTFEEYDRFCRDTRRSLPDDGGWGRGRRPVVNVSWEDARAYAERLGGQTGERYRLPSDAEWEYAARAGTTTRFWWGDEVGTDRANCEGCGSLWDGGMSAPVGRFEPNSFGLHDIAGNVFEWVADCFHDSFADAPPDGTPLEKPGCGKRVIRGGAWSFPPREIRSANRWRDFPSRSSDDTGFRLARDLQPGG